MLVSRVALILSICLLLPGVLAAQSSVPGADLGYAAGSELIAPFVPAERRSAAADTPGLTQTYTYTTRRPLQVGNVAFGLEWSLSRDTQAAQSGADPARLFSFGTGERAAQVGVGLRSSFAQTRRAQFSGAAQIGVEQAGIASARDGAGHPRGFATLGIRADRKAGPRAHVWAEVQHVLRSAGDASAPGSSSSDTQARIGLTTLFNF